MALGAALIGSQHEKCLYSQQSDSVTNLFAWLVQEIRLNGNPPERRPAFEGPVAFLTGEWYYYSATARTGQPVARELLPRLPLLELKEK